MSGAASSRLVTLLNACMGDVAYRTSLPHGEGFVRIVVSQAINDAKQCAQPVHLPSLFAEADATTPLTHVPVQVGYAP